MGTGESHDQKSFSLRNSFLFSAKGNKSSQPTVQREVLYQLEARQIERLDRTFWGVGGTQPAGTAGEGVATATAEGRAEALTYPAADGDQELSNCLRVVHHHRLHGAVQHADFLRPLFLLIFQDILDTSGAPHTEWKNMTAQDTSGNAHTLSGKTRQHGTLFSGSRYPEDAAIFLCAKLSRKPS